MGRTIGNLWILFNSQQKHRYENTLRSFNVVFRVSVDFWTVNTWAGFPYTSLITKTVMLHRVIFCIFNRSHLKFAWGQSDESAWLISTAAAAAACSQCQHDSVRTIVAHGRNAMSRFNVDPCCIILPIRVEK